MHPSFLSLSIHPFIIYPSICPSIPPSSYLSILSICPSFQLFIYYPTLEIFTLFTICFKVDQLCFLGFHLHVFFFILKAMKSSQLLGNPKDLQQQIDSNYMWTRCHTWPPLSHLFALMSSLTRLDSHDRKSTSWMSRSPSNGNYRFLVLQLERHLWSHDSCMTALTTHIR